MFLNCYCFLNILKIGANIVLTLTKPYKELYAAAN